jgi:7-cyano-7-deazaguanine reductase
MRPARPFQVKFCPFFAPLKGGSAPAANARCDPTAPLVLAIPYNKEMPPLARYTDDHAKAGLDFAFPPIETWKNQFPGYEITIDDPELTSVCPKTGLPDFGVLTIRYMPRERCLELKSLKEYLFCYRNLGIFQENIVNQVLEDVIKATDPVWAVVKGIFRPRGGIGTTVEARWPRTTVNSGQ